MLGSRAMISRVRSALLSITALAMCGLFAGQPAAAQRRPQLPLATGRDGRLGTFSVLGNSRTTSNRPPRRCRSCPLTIWSYDIEMTEMVRRTRGTRSLDLGFWARGPEGGSKIHLFFGVTGTAFVYLDDELLLSHESDRFFESHEHVEVNVPEGEHQISFRFVSAEGMRRWRTRVRVLDKNFQPGGGDVELFVHASRRDLNRMHEAVSIDERYEDGVDGHYRMRLVGSLPSGGLATPVSIISGDPVEPVNGVFKDVIEFAVDIPEEGILPAVPVGDASVEIAQSFFLDRHLLRAASALRSRIDQVSELSRGPIQWRIEEMEHVIAHRDTDRRWRLWLQRQSDLISEKIDAGQDPFADLSGYNRMGHISRLDGKAQPYQLFVPPGYRGERDWPLIITLHGFKGNAGDFFRNTFGLTRRSRRGETLIEHGRHGQIPERGPMFVIAPEARGTTHYRMAGEQDVLECIADVQRRFRIDPRRIYVTGGSMGGTGAAFLPFRNPDLFAGSIALAGYHDQRVRRDTDDDSLTPSEQFMMAHRSDVDWAENALHLPMLLVRGTEDVPLEWTTSLADRLSGLGYRHQHRNPVTGHNVWTMTYADNGAFNWFRPIRRPEHPDHVRLRTGRERTTRNHWVEINARSRSDQFADVDAVAHNAARISAHIEGARRVTFNPPGRGALSVDIDGTIIRGNRPLTVENTGGGWERADGPLPPGFKRAGVSGPIRDMYNEPLLFVVGTGHPDHTLINRIVAYEWAHPDGWHVSYPIVDDKDVTEQMVQEKTLVLVGPPISNSVFARLGRRLPIQWLRNSPNPDEDVIQVGPRRWFGESTGAVFIAPNPDNPDHSLIVIAGITPLGTWRSMSIPELVGDYAIFDDGLHAGRGQYSCGGVTIALLSPI